MTCIKKKTQLQVKIKSIKQNFGRNVEEQNKELIKPQAVLSD